MQIHVQRRRLAARYGAIEHGRQSRTNKCLTVKRHSRRVARQSREMRSFTTEYPDGPSRSGLCGVDLGAKSGAGRDGTLRVPSSNVPESPGVLDGISTTHPLVDMHSVRVGRPRGDSGGLLRKATTTHLPHRLSSLPMVDRHPPHQQRLIWVWRLSARTLPLDEITGFGSPQCTQTSATRPLC